MDGNLRRSGRRRTANIRYVDDASHLLETLDSEVSNTGATYAVEDREASEFDDATEKASASDAYSQSPTEDAPSSEDFATGDDGSDVEHSESHKISLVDRQRLRKTTKSSDSQHTRGLIVFPKLSKTWEISRNLVGTNKTEQERFESKLDHWFHDGVFPTRSRILQPGTEDEDAMTGSWTWYTKDGGSESFARMQTMRALSSDEGHQYYPPRHPVHKAVLGPQWQEKLYRLALDKPLHLANTWKAAPISSSGETQDANSPLEQNGWIINLGAKIQSISWAPLRDHDRQFLAVALDHPNPDGGSIHTAFEPSPAFKSCIQIWSFSAQKVDDNSNTLDPHQAPVLVHVVCTEWGTCKEIKWCPFPISEVEVDTQTLLGLLASIWSDGHVRVLDIKVPFAPSSSGLFVRYEKAAFAARPPNTICSSVSWSSSIDLIVGCANGRVAAWNIGKSIDKQRRPQATNKGEKPKHRKPTESTTAVESLPYLYHQLHDTYILGVEHCVPQFPWLLATLCADGTYGLYDLRNPAFDTVQSRRHRVYPMSFEYCPHLFGLMAADGYNGVNLRFLRHFATELLVSNSNARVSAVACGRAHAHSLVGLVDGTALMFNTVPRAFKDIKDKKLWEIVWFKHEWRPEEGLGCHEEASGDHTNGNSASEDSFENVVRSTHNALRRGISRITEAFEPYLYGQKPPSTPNKKRPASDKNGASRWETIFEEPSAITQLKWNPNPRCGGWAAAGMGSGLLRVEDLAI